MMPTTHGFIICVHISRIQDVYTYLILTNGSINKEKKYNDRQTSNSTSIRVDT